MSYVINKSKCVFCSLCEAICLFGAIKCNEKERYFEIDSDKCTGCGQCAASCGVAAITPSSDHKKLVGVTIIPEKCIGCSICRKNCPANAPEGVIKLPFKINDDKCIKCGVCVVKCPKSAIVAEYKQ